MEAVRLDVNLFAVYDRITRFIQIVEYDALRLRLRSLQAELEARRGEIEALKQAIVAAETPATVEEVTQLDWLHTIARDSDTIQKRIEEIAPEFKLAKEMWAAIERASQDVGAIK